MLSFYERMEAAKALKPASGGKVYRRSAPRLPTTDDHYSWCKRQLNEWTSDKRDILNTFRAVCLNPLNDQPDTWEFR